MLIALLKNSSCAQVANQWSLFGILTQEDLLDVIKDVPSIIEYLPNNLIMDKVFIMKCLHANGEVMCSLASHDDFYEMYGKCNKEFCEDLTTIALNSEHGHGFHVMENAFSALSMENVSENLWDLAVSKSILCLSLEGCPARFFNDKKILNKGFDTSIVDFFTAKEIFADNDLISEIFEERMKDRDNDTFYIKQFTNMMRGVDYDLTDASGGEEAVNFMLKVMSAGALREIKTFSDNTFFTKGESERFYMSGFLTREDIKIRINEEIFKRDVYVIEKDSQSGSTMTSKLRKCLL